MPEMREAVILEAVRTPLGKRNGSLKDSHPLDLLASVLREVVQRTGIDPALIDDHITGCVSQVGEQAFNVSRNAWLVAGLPETTPSTTIDRQCGSSQQAVHFAAQGVMSGAYDFVIASGVENMSRVPMGSSLIGNDPFNTMYHEFFTAPRFAKYEGKLVPQGISAELIATKWNITRDDADDLGYRSHARAAAATKAGYFKREILPLTVRNDQGEDVTFDRDEGVRMEPDREKMRDLKPAFQDESAEALFPGQLNWTITAGNSSQISDGAAAILIASREKAEQLGLRPRARIHTMTVVGDSPIMMLTAPIPATRKVLERSGLKLEDMDVVEINEAFASVVLAWQREFGIPQSWFEDHVNPNGGAIAMGHPLGASGGRLMTTLLHELERRGGRYGLQTMCEGGGLSNATIIERLS
jgi:acetyl-CoA acetyltransferase family protein